MMQQITTPVFRGIFISTRSGKATRYASPPVRATGNRVVLSALVSNESASSTLTFAIDGSYDGAAWSQLTTATQNSFGYNTVAQASNDYPLVRIRVTIAGTNVDAVFDASLAFSAQ